MSTYFIDTSALGRRYLIDAGTPWILSWILPSSGNVILIAELAIVEMYSLFAQREKDLGVKRATTLEASFYAHLTEKEYQVIPIDSPILEQARLLVAKYGRLHSCRTLDAIQLACAVKARNIIDTQITFVSADRRLYRSALDEGFNVDNPFLHS